MLKKGGCVKWRKFFLFWVSKTKI